jgi:hypothetical protein
VISPPTSFSKLTILANNSEFATHRMAALIVIGEWFGKESSIKKADKVAASAIIINKAKDAIKV